MKTNKHHTDQRNHEEDKTLASGEEGSVKTLKPTKPNAAHRRKRRRKRRRPAKLSPAETKYRRRLRDRASGGRQISRCSASSEKTKLSPAEKKDRKRLRERACQAKKREDPDVLVERECSETSQVSGFAHDTRSASRSEAEASMFERVVARAGAITN
ncbi:hypothetical protein THAOC_17380, partial [Thalassiosira oceanica]